MLRIVGRGAGLVLGSVVILVTSLFSTATLRDLERADNWVAHTQNVLLELSNLVSLVTEAETRNVRT
jgi:CHASE3 domain sensor protein